ncbi:Fibroblast growth factor 2 [Varanus komodoensis]|nr:Fibroblast growth factor 2 [Varanus komodoensis]
MDELRLLSCGSLCHCLVLLRLSEHAHGPYVCCYPMLGCCGDLACVPTERAQHAYCSTHAIVKLLLQAEERGVVSIKGVCANRFLAMNGDGRLLAMKYITDECFFFERLESNNYNTYQSRKYHGWYVALKRTGQVKPGSKTGRGQKAILFLPMSAKS